MTKRLIAVGRCTAGPYRIESEHRMYLVEVLRPWGWEFVKRTPDRYLAMSAYNELAEEPKRVLFIGAGEGAIIRDSEQEGHAATWAANNQSHSQQEG